MTLAGKLSNANAIFIGVRRVDSCLLIEATSSKTKCERSRKGRSLQHPKQISAPAIVEGTCYCVCSIKAGQ